MKSLRSEAHKTLIAELKKVRLSAEMTQAELAKRLSRPQSYVAKIETGERKIDVLEFVEWLDKCDAFERIAGLISRIRASIR